MERFEVQTNSEVETLALAAKLASKLQSNDVITLEGDLGAGKTTFTKGLAKGLGITRNVNSPTFTIIKEYKGRLPLYHMDVYRLEESDEDLGFEEYFDGGGVTVVEWAQFISEYLPSEYLSLEIRNVDEHSRTIIFHPKGKRYIQLCEEIIGK